MRPVDDLTHLPQRLVRLAEELLAKGQKQDRHQPQVHTVYREPLYGPPALIERQHLVDKQQCLPRFALAIAQFRTVVISADEQRRVAEALSQLECILRKLMCFLKLGSLDMELCQVPEDQRQFALITYPFAKLLCPAIGSLSLRGPEAFTCGI